MKITKFVLGDIRSNCYIIKINESALIIDPGFPDESIIDYLEKHNLTLKAIYITHGHFDHWGGVNMLTTKYPNVLVYAPKKDSFWFEIGKQNPWNYKPRIDTFVEEGDIITIESTSFKVYETPGHSLGGTILFSKPHLFTGDTLFKQSVGRTDIIHASFDALTKSVLRMYKSFSNETICYPGHGSNTTIGFEKEHNPFINLKNKH